MSTKELVKSNAEADKKPDEAVRITKNYWFMTQKFEKDAFYNFLEGMRDDEKKELLFTAVLAIDFGDGDTTAYAIIRELVGDKNDYKEYRLNITKESQVIPTIIGFKDGKTFIGKEAQFCPRFYQHFKIHPGDKMADRKNAGNWSDNKGTEFTYRELMFEFFKEVFNSIFNDKTDVVRSLDQACKDGKLLVCAGCPASDKWLNPKAQEEFRELIKEATGNPHVAVVPESTASLMTGMVVNPSEESTVNIVDISKGIAIFDFGSLSVDFTFILPGGIVITHSIYEIGGCDIDKLILDAALAKTGMSKCEIADSGEEYLIIARKIKENYYNHPDYQQIIRDFAEHFYFDKKFMDEEVWGKGKSEDHPGQILLEKCKTFVRSCHESVKHYGCENVLISGGTGNVTEFCEIVNEIFKTDSMNENGDENSAKARTHLISKEDPSFCVSRGLCLMKENEMIGISSLDSYRSDAEKASKEAYSEIIKRISEKTVKEFLAEFKNIVEPYTNQKGKIKTEDLIKIVEEEMKKNPELIFNDPEKLKAMLSEAVVEESNRFIEGMKSKADEISKTVYGTSFAFSPKLLDTNPGWGKGKNGSDMIDTSAVMTTLLSNKILNGFAFCISSVIVGIIVGIFLNSPLFAFVGAFLIDKKKFSRLTDKLTVKAIDITGGISSDKLADSLTKTDDERILNSLIDGVSKELEKESFFKEEITNYFKTIAEAILGKILFYVYDNEPKAL